MEIAGVQRAPALRTEPERDPCRWCAESPSVEEGVWRSLALRKQPNRIQGAGAWRTLALRWSSNRIQGAGAWRTDSDGNARRRAISFCCTHIRHREFQVVTFVFHSHQHRKFFRKQNVLGAFEANEFKIRIIEDCHRCEIIQSLVEVIYFLHVANPL